MKINKIKISKYGFIPFLFVTILLLLPDNFYQLFSTYSIDTYSFIAYKVVEYNFPIIQLIVITISLLYLNRRNIRYFLIPGFIFVIEGLRFLFGYTNIYTLSSYEGVIPIIVAIAFLIIIENYCREKYLFERFFNFFCISHILAQFCLIALGSGIPGRYNTINLGVETTGLLAAVYFLYLLKTKSQIKHKLILQLLASISLLLSGSRISLLLLIAILVFDFLVYIYNNRSHIKIKNYQLTFVFLCIIFVLLIYFNVISISFIDISRIADVFDMDSIQSDGSGVGRIESIVKGFDILKTNILGISFSPTNLQYYEYMRGFSTFPHSSALCWFIMAGPLFFVLIIFQVNIVVKEIKKGNNLIIVLLYLLIFLFVTGGISTNFKTYFIILLTYKLVVNNKKVHIKKNADNNFFGLECKNI